MPLLERETRGVKRQPIGEAFHPKRFTPLHLTLFHLFMRRVLSTELAELISLQPIRIILLVLHRRVIPLFAERTSHVDDFAHFLLRNSSTPFVIND